VDGNIGVHERAYHEEGVEGMWGVGGMWGSVQGNCAGNANGRVVTLGMKVFFCGG
jgi:hypothetical protein